MYFNVIYRASSYTLKYILYVCIKIFKGKNLCSNWD